MAKKGKYKGVPADLAAEEMLNNLIRAIQSGEPMRNYEKEMRRFVTDPKAQDRYAMKVATWIAAMRTPTVRQKISEAIQAAKSQYISTARAVREEVEARIRARVAA